MIDLSIYRYETILRAMLSYIPNTFDKRDTSPIPTALGPAAYALEDFFLCLDTVQRGAYISTAIGSDLDELSILGGVTRRAATPAVRLGVFNAPVPLGARFSTVNGTDSIDFIVTELIEGTAYQCQLTAETAGTIGNEYNGPILPITYVPDLTSAQITDILIPGDNQETDSQLRERLVEALNSTAFGGNIADYKEKAGAIAGVGGVQVYPTWDGGGTVKLSIMGSDYLPATPTVVQNVQNAIDPPTQGLGLGLAPIGATVTVVAPTALSVDVSATVSLQTGYNVDQVLPLVEAAIEAYLLDVRREWDTNISDTNVEYAANVYLSRVTAAIVGTVGVVNATDVTLNGAAADLILTETSATQQLPVLGTVTLT